MKSAVFKKITSISFLKNVRYSLLLTLSFILIIILFGEIYIRTFDKDRFSKKPVKPPFNTAIKDDLLGWKMTPNYKYTGELLDEGEIKYEVFLRFDENGFKEFGLLNSGKPKVFFVGDSYTSSLEVSNRHSFFRIIKDSLDIEIFAYGHSGYGSFQEFLFLNEWVEKIEPDLIVWQICTNDFMDNYEKLEEACGYSVEERRPYLNLNDKIYYYNTKPTWTKLKENILFFEWLSGRFRKLTRLLFKKGTPPGEELIFHQKRNYPLFDASVKRTENIFAFAKENLPFSKFIFFSADGFEPHVSEFKNIFSKLNLPFTTAASAAINQKVFNNETVKASDGYHWNEYGHQIVAETLVPIIRDTLQLN